MDSSEKLRRALAYEWEFVGDQNSLCQLLRAEVLKLRDAMQRIAMLADCGSDLHKKTYAAHYSVNSQAAPGWRVAEDMREIANDVVGNLPLKSLFKVGDRVWIKQGIDFGSYGSITHVGGDDGTYYGVKLDCHDREIGYSQYELGLL